ncbi:MULTISPECIES: YlmC/YmxH family sporulation protein [Paenisporosarcina]|uniref:YlmC/YmxH family sporulation protein n=1 Tax=Paenisporosarcina quisquiliarum TaxID=365346 RepID=A0A9X3LE11_9BACL|nr:YlmC/YmxH family sporulation protein [Paenisporosarcina quisquiliarum]MCZ8535564.1 YlmC/YmxH family sporulation protein [Paenisporosarcina quisquiliarum]
MKFTDIQQKEFIEASDGRMLGFVNDARISKENGTIESFFLAEPKKMLELFSGNRPTIVIRLSDIKVIGKDVVIVQTKGSEHG